MRNSIHWMKQRFELSRHGDTGNVGPMEGLRGFAVFLVFVTHYVTLMSPWIEDGSPLDALTVSLHSIGNTGVDLFFVLSGYLIYASMISRQQAFLPFIRRRIIRIYPAFTAVFVLYLVLSYLLPEESKIPEDGLAAVTYVAQNFLLLPGLFPVTPMITVAWSLSYEMFYYLAIPLIISVFHLRVRSPLWRTVFFLAVATAMAGYCAVNGGHVRLIMFIAGILLYEALRATTVTRSLSWVALLALAGALLAHQLPFSGPGAEVVKVLILSCAFFVVCFSCFSRPDSWLARGFLWTPLRWLGNMSYSYYLLHGLVLKGAYMALASIAPVVEHDSWVFFGMMPVMFVITLVPSAMLFVAIERPCSLNARAHRGSAVYGSSVALPH
jgi:exopolysaccharide production protein ExoZ